MQKQFLTNLQKGDFISFKYQDWSLGSDTYITGHVYNVVPVTSFFNCYFMYYTKEKFRAVPYKYSKFYNKYFINGKSRLFKKDNVYITAVRRFDKKLNKLVVIWQDEN